MLKQIVVMMKNKGIVVVMDLIAQKLYIKKVELL